MKTCIECNVFGKEFRKSGNKCKDCINMYERKRRKGNLKHKAVSFSNHLKNKYRIDIDCFNKMLQDQNEACAICKKPENEKTCHRLSIDHNHVNGNVRGLLCRKCNSIIGIANDNIELLKIAIQYIAKDGYHR